LGPTLITEKNEFLGLKIKVKSKGPKLVRRHPNGESEEILDGPTPMVRPNLRRDMVGVPEISGPQERERDVEHPERTSSQQGVHSPYRGTWFPGTGASQDLEVGF
jgi:hypothetical protein